MRPYLTGNEILKLSPDPSFLSKKFRGPVEFCGRPFLKPLIKIGPKAVDLSKEKKLKSARLEHWVPCHELAGKGFLLTLKILAPLSARGALFDYEVRNSGAKPLKLLLGAQGSWHGVRARGRELKLWRRGAASQEGGFKHLSLSAGGEAAEFAMAVAAGEGGLDLAQAAGGKELRWSAGKQLSVPPGGSLRFGIVLGLGLDEASAAASAADMRRQGVAAMTESTLRFLSRKLRFSGDSHLDRLLNVNLWHSYFSGAGACLDGGDFVSLGGEREALLLAFPAALLMDPQRARRMLEAAFAAPGAGLGLRERFADGSVLDPSFQLEALCAPGIALAHYVRSSGDVSLLKEPSVRRALRQAERTLHARKHPSLALYEAGCGPEGEAEPLPYVTTANVMAWRLQEALAELKPKMGRDKDVAGHKEQAEKIKSAVWKHLTAEGPRGRMFVWASDLRGGHRLGTSPSSCLRLLPYFGFCDSGEQAWKNTLAYLHSREHPHSNAGEPFEELGSPPGCLGLAASLLCGRKEKARALLERMEMEGGLASRAFSPKDGKSLGAAPAWEAGFFAWSLWKAFGREKPA